MVSDHFLSLLVCPMGHAPLRRDGESLICTRCQVKYAIHDDIPNMIVEEAELPAGCACLADLECVKTGAAKVDVG